MASTKSKAIEHERRSSKQPTTELDKKLSEKHLKDSIKFNEHHARDHKELLKHDEQEMKHAKSKALKKKLKKSEEYNADHAKKHDEDAEEDKAELKKKEVITGL